MKDNNQGTEKEIQDPLTPYLDAEARRRASATKAPKSEDEGQDDVNDDYTIVGSPASDEAVRLAISLVPNLAGRRSVGNQQKWDTFVKERSGGNGGVLGLP